MSGSTEMRYHEKTGDYADAYADVLNNGGQLYPGNGKDSASVVVRGRNCFVYWTRNSRRHAEVKILCEILGIEPYAMTGGRIARLLVKNILDLPYQETFWSKKYRGLARKGEHWHYLHVEPNAEHWGVEFDIKSAYISSYLQFPSMLYKDGVGYLADNNAMENLRILNPQLPKWFRLQLLGCLASWRFGFLAQDKKNSSNQELVYKSIQKISFNAAFNTAHRAILRTYKIMEKIHKIGGIHIKRIHTDSFFLSWECPQDVEEEIWNFIESKQLEVAVKGAGKSYFFDVNTGFIGKKLVGSKLDIASLMRENNVKIRAQSHEERLIERFGQKVSDFYDFNNNCEADNREERVLEQLSLF